MFDIGFMELVLIGIVALLVVGPEKLPDTIRTAALLIGRAKRSFNQVKADIEREINADDIRRQLHNEAILADIEKAKKDANKLITDTKQSLDSVNADVNSTLAREKKALDEVLQDETAASTPATQAEPASEQPPQASAEAKSTDSASADVPGPATTSDAASTAIEDPSTPQEDKAAEPALKPVEDFYNNPPSGVIRLQNGVFQQVVSSEESSDQEPQRKS